MDTMLAICYLFFCLFLVSRVFTSDTLIKFHLCVLGAFSIGYYPLPVLLKTMSGLDRYHEEDVFLALFMHLLFLLFLVVGAHMGVRLVPRIRPLSLPVFDGAIHRNSAFSTLIALSVYLIYYSTQDITSYSAADFEDFFHKRDNYFAIFAAISGQALGVIAVVAAYSQKEGKRFRSVLAGGGVVICVLLAVPLSQRAALLAPIFYYLIALVMTKQTGRAVRLLLISVVGLLFLSPVIIALRELRSERDGRALSEVTRNISYGDNPFMTGLQSIVDRSDLIQVTVDMKSYIDSEPAPDLLYYQSVLVIPIPRLIYEDKPYPLSVDGTFSGELSNWAWKVLRGGTGSLTAFGGLAAYREGGWLWIPINAIATGLLFAALGRWLGEGGMVAQVFYAYLFVPLAMGKVPPSFFESLIPLLGQMPFILALIIAHRLFRGRHRMATANN